MNRYLHGFSLTQESFGGLFAVRKFLEIVSFYIFKGQQLQAKEETVTAARIKSHGRELSLIGLFVFATDRPCYCLIVLLK
jgi:hypothetical protein